MAGLKTRSAVFAPKAPAIHVLEVRKAWMPGIKPGMTVETNFLK
jgi:hypothetical protein